MIATLSIHLSRYSQDFELEDQDGFVHARVPVEEFSSRPDPVRRDWAYVEAKRGMR